MIQPISKQLFHTGKYFSILKFIILQQNISSVWIFGDQNSWCQYGQEMDGVLQHLVGTLPKYVFDLNHNKTCVDNEEIKNLNIFFVSQKFGKNELNSICSTDYTIVLAQSLRTKVVSPQKIPNNIFHRIVFGSINTSTIADMKNFQGIFSTSYKKMEDLFIIKSLNLNASAFRIFFQLGPPTSMFSLVGERYIFYGPDALMAQEISKMLNATAIIETNIGVEYPLYKTWFNDTRFDRTKIVLQIHKRMLTRSVISNFYQK